MAFYRTLVPNKHLDENWLHLMIAARDMGISKKEVLQFIRQTKTKQTVDAYEK